MVLSEYSRFLHQNTYHHDIAEILLKVVLNIIIPNLLSLDKRGSMKTESRLQNVTENINYSSMCTYLLETIQYVGEAWSIKQTKEHVFIKQLSIIYNVQVFTETYI